MNHYDLDKYVYNADWPKKTWDGPLPGTKEFADYLERMGLTEEEFAALRASQTPPGREPNATT